MSNTMHSRIYLIRIQFGLVNRIGTFDDFHHFMAKTFSIKLLNGKQNRTILPRQKDSGYLRPSE